MSIIYIAPHRIFQDATPRARDISTQRPNRGIFQSQTESIRITNYSSYIYIKLFTITGV